MPFTIPVGATRSLWHSVVNPPRACRAGHPRAVTRGSILQSTILTVENNGATRSLWHNSDN